MADSLLLDPDAVRALLYLRRKGYSKEAVLAAFEGITPPSERIPFERSFVEGVSVYSRDRCSFCCLPVGSDAPLITLTRTDDGRWWVVSPNAPVREDETAMGNPHFTLPLGPGCLHKHPEFRVGLVTSAREPRS